MSCFNKVSTITANRDLDLTKHVNYTSGMILGVDDFTQEFGYLSGRDRWLARDALGYGTISGLKIAVETDGAKGARVMVYPGVAVSPRGQFICVPTSQCAYLNEWLAANEEQIRERAETGNAASPPVTTSPPAIDELELYVVLCYRDCPVDNVPIPGEPCRSEDELSAPSRIKDDFSLELRFEAPAQPEEIKVREFVEWLRQVRIVETGASTALAEFIEAVRAAWLTTSSPPVVTSPPHDLRINVADLAEYTRTALRLWVTELRNILGDRKTGCAQEMTGGAAFEDCVLLARLRVPLVALANGYKVSDSEPVAVGEDNRPFLLHLRLLQELLLRDYSFIPGSASPVTSPPVTNPPVTSPPAPEALDDLSDVEISSPEDGQVLIFDGSKWVNKTPETGGEGGVTDHGNLVGLGDDDHERYILTDGTRAMTGSFDAGGNRVTNLKAAETNGEAVVFEQAIKRDDEAKGDLGGKYPEPTVEALQGSKISPSKPKPDDLLIFKGGAWTPHPLAEILTPTSTPQKASLILPLATISKIKNPDGSINPAYEIWFNIDAPGNLVRVVEFKNAQLQIQEETDQPTSFLNSRIRFNLTPGIRNVFVCSIVAQGGLPPGDVPPSGKLRFRFDMSNIGVEIANPRGAAEKTDLAQYAEKSNIKFSGSIDGKFATIFVRGESGATIPR